MTDLKKFPAHLIFEKNYLKNWRKLKFRMKI